MIKVDVVSGFLGAGKTTFIRKMIDEAFSGEKIVLIENEFGEVGIDGGFLRDAGIEITEMNSGCICCSLVGDFDRNLKEVADRFSPDRIIIEPSGVGKLSDVSASVVNVSKEKPMEINALVTVVNAKKAKKQMKAFGEFFNNQIELANTVILSRTQDMEENDLEEAVGLIRDKNPNCAVITTPWDKLSSETILKAYESKSGMLSGLLEEAQKEAAEHAKAHDHEHDHDHDMNMNTTMNTNTIMTMTTKAMNTIMTMTTKAMNIIMTMRDIIITTIMQTRCLRSLALRLPTGLTGRR